MNNRKFCTKCGNPMKDNTKICDNCGAMNEVETVKTKGAFVKNNLIKIVIGLIAIFLVGLFLTKQESRNEVIENLQSAIVEKNVSKLEKIIVSSDERLKIDDKVVNILLSYYEDVPSRLDSDIDNLLEGYEDYTPYKLKKKKGLFGEKYVVVLQSRFIHVDGKADNIEIQIKHGDEVIKTVDKYGEIGPLAPGVYTVEGILKNDYVTRKESIEVDLFLSELEYEYGNYIELFSEVSSIEVKSNKPEAILYINDKSTEKKIKDLKNIVGLEENTKLHAVIKEGGKTLNSNVEEVYGDGTYELNFQEINKENLEDTISTFIDGYEEGYQNAINTGNFSLVASYLLEGSDVYNEYEESVDLFYEKNIRRYNSSWNIENINDLGNDIYKVDVSENVLIDRDGDEKLTKLNLKFTIEFIDGNLYITKAIEK